MQDDIPGSSQFVRTGDTWLAYLLTAYFAYLVNAFGPLMPFLRSEMGMAYTMASLHFSAFAGGRVLAGLASDRLIVSFGRQRMAWGGAAGAAAGAALLLLGRQPAVTIAGALLMGLMGGNIPVIVQAALAQRHGALRGVAFAEVNAIASASAVLAPLCIGLMARTYFGWRGALVVAVLTLVPLRAAMGRYTFGGMARQSGAGSRGARLPGLFWVYWTVLMLVVATEFCVAFWATDFLEKTKGLTRADAALISSLFLAGMLLGRLAGSRLLRRRQGFGMLFASLGVAVLGYLILWTAQPLPLTIAGLFTAGLGIANLYPLGLTFAMGTAPQQLDVTSARATLAVAVAMLFLPLLLGRLADIVGIHLAYGMVAVLLGLAALAILLARSLEGSAGRRALRLASESSSSGQ